MVLAALIRSALKPRLTIGEIGLILIKYSWVTSLQYGYLVLQLTY